MIEKKIALIPENDAKYLLNEEVLKLPYPKKLSELKLPANWWSTSNSFSFYGSEEKDSEVQLFRIRNNSEIPSKKNKRNRIIENPIFDASNGDHIITNSDYLKKDYTHYRKVKERMLKYSIYPAIIISLLFTFFILSMVVVIQN